MAGKPGAHSRPLRVLIAPGAFKESMTATAATDAIAAGAQRAAQRAGATVAHDRCPISDGGDGFLEALLAAPGGPRRLIRVSVPGPLGDRVEASIAVDAAAPHRTAIIESAGAVGLRLIPAPRRDPERATTSGLAHLIRRALDEGCTRLLIGLGGSATCDGAVGVAAALGVRFTDGDGRAVPSPTGADLARIASIDVSGLDPRIRGVRVTCACDVDNPLTGPCGAARVYAPQKGATPRQAEQLDLGLTNLAGAAQRAGLRADPELPGAGAAGGLGFGLAAFIGAELRPGADVVFEALCMRDRLRAADVVLTGEGRLDGQSLRGKATVALARLAARCGVPTVALVGALGDGAGDAIAPRGPLTAAIPIARPDVALDDSLRRGPELLTAAAERIVADWLAGSFRATIA